MEAPSVPDREFDARQLLVIASLLMIAAASWLISADRMAGMASGPGTDPGAIGFYATVWVVMMAAMMFPSAAPMVRAYSVVGAHKRGLHGGGPVSLGTAAFVGGYLLAWAGFGLLAYGLYEAARSLDLKALAWDEYGRYLVAGVVATAAAYQLTSLKDACLRRCRGPLGFVAGNWRAGGSGALRMGFEHGAWCIGCCWALMAVLFALGVMSIAWMAFIAAAIAIEKMLPWRIPATYGVAAVLALLAAGVAVVPQRVPGLTVPGESAAGSAMRTMR